MIIMIVIITWINDNTYYGDCKYFVFVVKDTNVNNDNYDMMRNNNIMRMHINDNNNNTYRAAVEDYFGMRTGRSVVAR